MANFVKVARVGDVAPGRSIRVLVQETPIAIFNVDGKFYAIHDTCSHAEASLSEGRLEGHVVACPRHGAKFDVRTGDVLSLPAWAPVNAYEVRVEGGDILINPEPKS